MVVSLYCGGFLLNLVEIKYKLCSIYVLYIFFKFFFEVVKFKLKLKKI